MKDVTFDCRRRSNFDFKNFSGSLRGILIMNSFDYNYCTKKVLNVRFLIIKIHYIKEKYLNNKTVKESLKIL